MDGFNKFEENALPPKEEFYSILNNTDISDNDYTHATKVWETGDYHDLYLRSDVLLLADVFETFRSTCTTNYELDP